MVKIRQIIPKDKIEISPFFAFLLENLPHFPKQGRIRQIHFDPIEF
ncbi:MAG: hypothetical protein Q8R15_03560 [Candidatus Micrarchaeota archaeon]|nr:hypothetical protein [Candidatus Micrarchaeota archaeon]